MMEGVEGKEVRNEATKHPRELQRSLMAPRSSKMTFTADQYSQIAEGYEKAAADPMVASEKRAALVRKAEWFRFLAGHEAHRSSGGDRSAPTCRDPEPAFQGSWRMAPFLTTLWATGAAVYLVGTVLFTNAVNLFGAQELKTPVPEIMQSIESGPKVTSVEVDNKVAQAYPRPTVIPERPHAISPDEPTYESPALTAPPPARPREVAGPASSEPAQKVSEVEPPEIFIVTAEATIRNGPSKSSKKIGIAIAGAKLRVKAREKDWVQFVDPSSGNTGWIQSAILASASESEAHSLASPEVPTTPPNKAAKPKLAKKKPTAAKRPSSYADLPADEEFIPARRRGPGLLDRRRMLGDGLMSPGFLPPD
jgi:uncharacterized protein YgiM (DUF1202 family)